MAFFRHYTTFTKIDNTLRIIVFAMPINIAYSASQFQLGRGPRPIFLQKDSLRNSSIGYGQVDTFQADDHIR